MKKLKQFGLFLSPFGVLIIISAIWILILKPKLIEFIQTEIPKISAVQNMGDLTIQALDLSFLKLQAQAETVRIDFKNEFKNLKPISIEKIKLQVDPFKLLVGQISLSKIQLDEIDWTYESPASSKKSFEELPLTELFKYLPQIPIDQIYLNQVKINFKDETQSTSLHLKFNQVFLQNKKSFLNIALNQFIIEPLNTSQTNLFCEINLAASLRSNNADAQLIISLLEMKALDSHFKLTGQFNQFKNILIHPEGKVKIESELHFDDLRTLGLSLFPQKNRLPSITGSLQARGDLQINSLQNVNGQFLFETKQVSIDHFKLGQAQVKAEIKKNQIYINQIEVEHPSGLASLKEIEIEQKSPYNFKARMDVRHFDLQKLFISIGLNDIPAGTLAEGEVSCSGHAEPSLLANCEVSTDLKDIWLKPTTHDTFHILKIKNASIKGQMNVTPESLNYKANLKVGQSEGESQGEVIFAEGFKLGFETKQLHFSDVESLADLNFKGALQIKGTTSGDTKHGVIDANMSFTDGEIDRFRLGHVDSVLKYEKAQLQLKQIVGSIGQSNYQGDLLFDFKKSEVKADLVMKQLSGEDLFFALKNRFEIPFDLTGRGQAEIKASGPFDFWKLKYKLKGQLKQGSIAEESFENLNFNLTSDGEAVHFDQVSLKKNRSLFQLEGEMNTTKNSPSYNLKIKAEPFNFEESDHLIKLVPALTGQTWINGQIKGELLNPELNFNFYTRQMTFENNDYPNSQGQVIIDKKFFKFVGQLFGRQIQSDIVWPWNVEDPYSVRLQVRDLNPLILLPLVSLPQPSSEYYSRLNADVELKANRREFKSSEGTIKINDFILQRGALYFKLVKASSLYFKKGLRQMDSLALNGESNRLLIKLANANAEEAKVTFEGDMQLKQFQFLVPFAQGLSGRLQIDSQVLFKNNDFQLYGDGEITDAVVNLKGFPQAIENINTPIEFSKSKILLSDLTAQLGQSEINGQGQIDIKGPRQILVNLQATAENVELTFPEQVTTAGKADLVFFGSWLPYTLKVNYKVSRGLVEKDFGQDDPNGKTTLKSSPYLPPQQIEAQSPSILLDVAVDMSQGVIVKNRILEGEATGQLQINGTPENPAITGRIDIKSGSKLIFKDKAFDIQTATIQFPPSTEINPDVYITANSRVSDYDINLLVQGPAKNLSIKPTSQPPLSVNEIFSLLALGLTTSKLDQNLSSETQQQQTGLEIIASRVNQSQVNKKFQEKFGLTVQLAPTVDSTKNIAVPKVVVTKKIQKNVNASYSRPLTGDTQNQEWKLQYLFNPNKSLNLNYQNNESNKQDQIRSNNSSDTGILGLDFEYKKEFK